MPRSAFGPSVQAWIGLLSGAYRMSKRNIVALLADAFSLDLAVGSVSRLEQHVSEALAAPVEEARDYVRQQAAVHIDETGWREARQKAWLWTVATDLVTVFAIRSRRDSEVARELLGDHTTAIVGCDRQHRLQLLARVAAPGLAGRTWNAPSRSSSTEAATRPGSASSCWSSRTQMFTWWHRVGDGTLKRSSFQTYVSDLRLRVGLRMWQGELLADDQTARTCANLRAIEPALWTFVRQEGVEPTNNAAERALRHGVLWRKGSFGTHSPAGSRFVERILTVRDTLRQQQRNVLDYLTEACQATLHHRPAPSILPQSASTRA